MLHCAVIVSLCLHVINGADPQTVLDELKRTQGKSLILIGGSLGDNAEIYSTIINMTGGPGQSRIGIVTSAGADPNDDYHYYSQELVETYGAAEAVHINVSVWDSSVALDPVLVEQIHTLTGFFFSGGDQSRITKSMYLDGHQESPVLAAIREQFNKGAPIAGTSAGTACLTANYMIASGVSWFALVDGSSTNVTDASRPLTYNPQGGLGFLDGYITDSHFLSRGREGRLIRLLSDTKDMPLGTAYGIGVDITTALVITHADSPRAEGKVIGESGVTFIDISNAVVDTTQTYFSIRDVKVTYLSHGDVYNLRTHDVTFAPDKTPLKNHENFDHAQVSDDVFYGSNTTMIKSEFLRVAASIFDARLDTSSYGTTYYDNPRFRVEMSAANDDAEGYVKRVGTFQTDLHSYKNLMVAIREDQ